MGAIRRSRTILLAFALTVVGCAPAFASLIGTSWHVDYYFPDTSTIYAGATATPNDFVVGAGVKSVINVEGLLEIQVDFSDTGINIFYNKLQSYSSQWGAAQFSGLIFTLLDPTPLPFSSLIATTQPYMPGFDNSRVTVSADSFAFNWQGLVYDPGNPDNNGDGLAVSVQAVPEPSSLPLLFFGSAATLIWGARRLRGQLVTF